MVNEATYSKSTVQSERQLSDLANTNNYNKYNEKGKNKYWDWSKKPPSWPPTHWKSNKLKNVLQLRHFITVIRLRPRYDLYRNYSHNIHRLSEFQIHMMGLSSDDSWLLTLGIVELEVFLVHAVSTFFFNLKMAWTYAWRIYPASKASTLSRLERMASSFCKSPIWYFVLFCVFNFITWSLSVVEFRLCSSLKDDSCKSNIDINSFSVRSHFNGVLGVEWAKAFLLSYIVFYFELTIWFYAVMVSGCCD